MDHRRLGDLKVVGQAINMTKTPEPARMRLPTPDRGQHNDEILRELGYNQAESPSCATRERLRSQAPGSRGAGSPDDGTMLDQPLTSKMLIEKDGAIGRIIFNNPARHNAVSLEMWQGDRRRSWRTSTPTTRSASSSSPAPGANPSSRAPTSPSSRKSATARRRPRNTPGSPRPGARRSPNTLKPTIAMIRGYCIGGGLARRRLRHPHRRGGIQIRHPGGEARPRLCL